MIIKEEVNDNVIKLKQRIDYEYDFDEDNFYYDESELSEKLNEEAQSIVDDRDFINSYMEEKANYIKGIDIDVGDSFIEAIVYLNSKMSRSDVEFYFSDFLSDIVSEMSSVYVDISGESDYDDFDPSTDYGHVSRSEHIESEGTVSISTAGKVQIEYNK